MFLRVISFNDALNSFVLGYDRSTVCHILDGTFSSKASPCVYFLAVVSGTILERKQSR